MIPIAIIFGVSAFGICMVLFAAIESQCGSYLQARRFGSYCWFTFGVIITATSFHFIPDLAEYWRHSFGRGRDVVVTTDYKGLPETHLYGRGYLVMVEAKEVDGKDTARIVWLIDDEEFWITRMGEGMLNVDHHSDKRPNDGRKVVFDFLHR